MSSKLGTVELTEALHELMAERKQIFLKMDEIAGDENHKSKEAEIDKLDKEVDVLADQIRFNIGVHRHEFTVETILEGIASLGGAPSLLYDDNGHWTIGENGSQNLPTFDDDFATKETVLDASWIVRPGGWHRSIREALNFYLDKKD